MGKTTRKYANWVDWSNGFEKKLAAVTFHDQWAR